MAKIISTNPAKNYEALWEVEVSSDQEIQTKVAAANKAKLAWKELGLEKRIHMLTPIFDEFKQRLDEMALLISQETGKPISQAMDEVQWHTEEFDSFIRYAQIALWSETTHEDTKSLHKIVYEPIGTAAVISPWNYPLGMALWGIIPNLLAGNTVVFKISEECPLMWKLIEEVMNNHNLPEGVFWEVYGAGDVGEKLARSDINLIRFTGSTKVGQLLYKIAAEKCIKALLEMWWSNPCIVFDDVDVADILPTIYTERFSNCGQVCDATKRLIVHTSIFNELVDQLKNLIATKKVGDPMSQNTDIGSLAAYKQQHLLQWQVADAQTKWATIINVPLSADIQGAFYPPTLITTIHKDMQVWTEEVFGPVLPIIAFTTEEEAVALANDTIYWLWSRIFSKDIVRAQRVASQIEAGTVEINKASRRHPANPFGGYKKSWIGREHGVIWFRELCQVKVISQL